MKIKNNLFIISLSLGALMSSPFEMSTLKVIAFFVGILFCILICYFSKKLSVTNFAVIITLEIMAITALSFYARNTNIKKDMTESSKWINKGQEQTRITFQNGRVEMEQKGLSKIYVLKKIDGTLYLLSPIEEEADYEIIECNRDKLVIISDESEKDSLTFSRLE